MAKIKKVQIQKVLGFRSSETISVQVEDDQGKTGSAMVAFGKSEGKYEAEYLAPDKAALKAEELSLLLAGIEVLDQKKIDQTMIDYDATPQKKNLGGNVILGVGLACTRLGALESGQPLYLYLRQIFSGGRLVFKPPRILHNLIEGGVHANNNLPIQEHLVIPLSQPIKNQIEILDKFSDSFLIELEKQGRKINYGDEGGFDLEFKSEDQVFALAEEFKNQNNFQFDWGIDAAANNIKNLDPDYYLNWYQELAEKYPFVYLEDPFAEENQEKYWQEIFNKISDKTLIVGDDLTVTNPRKLKEILGKKMINGIIIKPDQVGSLTEAFETIRMAKESGLKIAVSHRSQETTDNYLADLAVAVSADFVKFGAFYQGERLAKYNRLLEIEKSIENF
ncbi:MAG: hypothetical protein AB1721_03080 [Patescibacteria group bacterium]